MSLGNFVLGSTVRIPLQILEDGVPAENIDSVLIKKIIKPDLTEDSAFPQNMVLLDEEHSLYIYDYTPEDKGNYIVIYSVTMSGISFSQMDSFFISGPTVSSAIPSAKPSYVIMTSTTSSSIPETTSNSGGSSSGAKPVSSSESSESESESSKEESSKKFRPSARGL